ncbi:hypothetical protein [Nocardia pneumoniae]|uniref:hypothetical protein n=1 Tax=Nocardia pneumoniae TaxID=228601 RepID=UPI0002D52CCA|nr:hypothetical protein [Nocardia pneumoniae]
MIGRLLILAMIPAWVWVVLGVTTGLFGVIVVLVLVIGGATSSIASDLHYQCDSAVGPDPSQTVTPSRASVAARPTTRSASADGVSTAPTANPFAELTIAPDDTSASDWQRACATALKDAPYQSPPLLTGSSGIGAACARELALAAASASGAQSRTGGRADPAEFTKSVIYHASIAQSTGRCELIASPAAQPPAADIARQPSGSARRPCGQADGSGTAVVVLPDTIAAQGACGQRVDPSAVSAGDLVFWSYRKNAPTQVGIAVSASQLVTADTAGGFVELAIPSTDDVRVKRVLGGGM